MNYYHYITFRLFFKIIFLTSIVEHILLILTVIIENFFYICWICKYYNTIYLMQERTLMILLPFTYSMSQEERSIFWKVSFPHSDETCTLRSIFSHNVLKTLKNSMIRNLQQQQCTIIAKSHKYTAYLHIWKYIWHF